MIKLSEALMYYEGKKTSDEVEQYFLEPEIYKKIADIKALIEILGDVDFEIDSFKAFLYKVGTIKVGRFGITQADFSKKIKTMYELIKGSKLSSDAVCTLFDYYKIGVYEVFEKDIKIHLQTTDSQSRESLSTFLIGIAKKAKHFAFEEAKKMEELKAEYDPDFISKLQAIVMERIIPYEKVLSILPSKELIASSQAKVPYFEHTIISGKDLVERRLTGYISDEEIEQTPMDEFIKLGVCSTGEFVYTSFTKKEYIESLKIPKSRI